MFSSLPNSNLFIKLAFFVTSFDLYDSIENREDSHLLIPSSGCKKSLFGDCLFLGEMDFYILAF